MGGMYYVQEDLLYGTRQCRRCEPTVKIAVNNGLQCMYKIGVYGDVKQHEVLVYGTWWNYMRFKNELDKPRKKR